jgi:hypothetical protein
MPFCTKCGEALTGKTCVKCTSTSSSGGGVRCHQCNASIVDPNEVLVIGGREYHRACKGFGSTSSLESKGGVWDSSKNNESCPGCGKPIAKNLELDNDVIVVGGATWHRACKGIGGDSTPKAWAGNKQDLCGVCSKVIAPGAVDVVIVAGTPFHRSCKGLDRDASVKTWAGNKAERCPVCQKEIVSGGDAANDTVIILGAAYHRACKGMTGESQAKSSAISTDDHCVKCHNVVGLVDKVIVRGQVYCRSCFDPQSSVIS